MAVLATLSPYAKIQFFDNNGAPAAGYKLFTYDTGTTTKRNTWTAADESALNTNPIILDASGRAVIYLDPAFTYKYVLASPTSPDPPTSPIWTIDPVTPVPLIGTNVDVAGVAGETITQYQAVYLEPGTGGTAGRWYRTSNFTLVKSAEAPRWGFAQNAATVGAAVTVRLAGRTTHPGPLVAGSTYYFSNTAGALETPQPSAEVDFEFPYEVGIADTTTSLVFPMTTPSMWTKAALRTIAFGTGQGNAAGGADTELTNYDSFIPGGYLATAGNAIVIEGTMTVAANGDTKTVKVKVGGGTITTLWTSAANVANHVVPFRIVITRRTATTGAVWAIFYDGVASGVGVPAPFMTYTTLGTIAWASNQVLNLYLAANTVNSIVMNDLITYGIRTPNGAVV